MKHTFDARTLVPAALGAALALAAVAAWPHIPGPAAAMAAEQPQDPPLGNPSGGLQSTVQVLLRIESKEQEQSAKLADVAARLVAIEKQLSTGAPVRIVEPLPAGLRSPGAKDKPAPAEPPAPNPPAPHKPRDK